MTSISEIVDLDRYPLHQPESTGCKDLVDLCQKQLNEGGMFNLDGFLRPEIAQQITQALLPGLATESFHHERRHNIYFKRTLDGLAEDHPALQTFQTANQTLCADQLRQSTLITLYEWPQFAAFLARVMGMPDLFVMDDPLARVNVMSYTEGQALNWHFDRSEFTTTLLLQAPDLGGEFEYRTDLRSDSDPNYEGVATLLNGEDKRVRRLQLTPGTLNVFKGRNTAHRVTPVVGDTARVIAVFSYYENAGVVFSEEERVGFYGRAG